MQFHIRSMANLEETIGMAREAVDATPQDHPDRAALLNNLGIRLGNRYSRTGSMADLEEAIGVAREAVDTTPQDHPDRASRLNNLGNRLGDRYSRTGAMADLEEAIGVAREAVDTTPQDHPNHASRLNNLGAQLSDRYSRTGAMADLEEAIGMARKAVDATPQDHPDRAGWLNNLGNLLGDRYSRTGAMSDLEEAIGVAREAVDTTPQDHPDRASRLNNLGNRLGDRYSRTGAMADLEEAIGVAREAVDTTPQDHPDRATLLNNLGIRLGDRYSRTGAMADLEEAIGMARKAVDTTPQDHPDRASRLNNLGNRLGDRYSRTGAMPDLEKANIYFSIALNLDVSPVSERIRAGRRLLSSSIIFQNVQKAYEIAQTTIQLIPLLAPRSLQNTDKQHLLSQAAGLASDAAAVALQASKGNVTAIEMLETGRGVLTGTLYDMRTDFSTLRQQYPKLAQSFIDLRNKLDTPISRIDTLIAADDLTTTVQAEANRRREASRQLDTLINKIRRQPGFGRFLLPPSEVEMQKAALAGFRHVIGTLWSVDDRLCVDMARITYGVLRDEGISDGAVSAGLHRATRELRNQWVQDVDATGREESQGSRSARDVELCGSTETRRPPHWIPYVHFGV
ncbi:hypothetical protein DL768_011034 [Monosporascus sp. mg162]|nr:hypothetical protein DL768_011034 [Monosporascus sp. mg162]